MADHPPADFAEVFEDQALPTIIGGQAVNLWAQYYSSKAPELERFKPFTSRDGDLWANRETVIALRDRTGWKCQLYDEPRTHAVGILTKEIPGQKDPLKIEILKDVHGLTEEDLAKSTEIAIDGRKPMKVLDAPVLLKGKIATLHSFSSKDRPNDERHILLLIPITRCFLIERVEAVRKGLVKERNLLAAVRYALEVGWSIPALELSTQYGFDFSAVMPAIDDFTGLPRLAKFIELELPRIAPILDRGSIEPEID
jgi:hypothetical protein